MGFDATTETVRLNLGAGEQQLLGFQNWDRKTGQEVYPLAVPDGSVDEIRASHVLEHFSHLHVGTVLADWVRALKPGGVLRIAVPDFQKIARAYLSGQDLPIQGYIMGGHVDGDDHHGVIFDEGSLREAMTAAGLVEIHHWQSEAQDCAALPISLNLAGRKPSPDRRPYGMKVAAVMSVPRLGFMDNFSSAFEALLPLGIKPYTFTGAFWGQCLERGIEACLDEGYDTILTIDYDTIYNRQHVDTLLSLFAAHPEVDALAPIQAARTKETPLFTIPGPDGKNTGQVTWETFQPPLTRARTAHFGLTLLRASSLRHVPHPWFHSKPDGDGKWGDGRHDDDTAFWLKWQDHGKTLYLANRVAVGHAELMIRWPGQDLGAIYQHPNEWKKDGPPKDAWE